MLNVVIIVCLSYFTELEWYIYLDASTWETAASLRYKGKLSQSFIIKIKQHIFAMFLANCPT